MGRIPPRGTLARAPRAFLRALWFSSLLAAGAVSAQPAGADGALTGRLRAELAAMQLPAAALARDLHAQGALPLPAAWRRDPLRQAAAVEALQRTLSRRQADPVAVLDALQAMAHGGRQGDAAPAAPLASPGVAALAPPPAAMPQPLRGEITRALADLALAARWRDQALSALPPSATPAALWRQLIPAAGPEPQDSAPDNPPALATLLPLVDHQALGHGLRLLARAAQRLQRRIAAAGLPAGAWRWPTALGDVVVDTSGACNLWTGRQPLLLIDVGGNDTYRFDEPSDAAVRLLLDHGGDDDYASGPPGTDPSGATLGYAVLWDSQGDDRYRGEWLAQGAAVLGAALHLDTRGNDLYQAQGMAQAFALGGLALLVDRGGNDVYRALTQAQASAGPDGLAVLLDTRGDDHYVLAADPVVAPSAQLPGRNASLGQGAAYGWRARKGSAEAPGGWALLMDLKGDDRYEAQVFAQAAGYAGGLGMLVDADGDNRWQGAWYAMGAAAHGAGALFMAGGTGNDRYAASHSMSLGAAHDDSLALFLERGGDDRYSLGALGLGAAHDHGTALFFDAGGGDGFDLQERPCRAFGAGAYSGTGDTALPPNTAVFIKRGGRADRYPEGCGAVAASRATRSAPGEGAP